MESVCRIFFSVSLRIATSAASSGSGTFSSVRKWRTPTPPRRRPASRARPRLRAPHDLLDLVERQVEIDRDLERQRLTAQLRAQFPLRPTILLSFSTTCTGILIVLALSAMRVQPPAGSPRRIRRELEPLR